MSELFVISDHHFWHSNIIKYENRPFANVAEMNEQMIQSWNSVVTPEDVVFHIGDFSFGGRNYWDTILERLDGRIIYFRGNHDRVSRRQLKKRFVDVFDMLILSEADVTFCHYPKPAGKNITTRWLISGHSHTKKPSKYQYLNYTVINVSVEHLDYVPRKLDTIIPKKNVDLVKKWTYGRYDIKINFSIKNKRKGENR